MILLAFCRIFVWATAMLIVLRSPEVATVMYYVHGSSTDMCDKKLLIVVKYPMRLALPLSLSPNVGCCLFFSHGKCEGPASREE